MSIHATTPLNVDPDERSVATYALTVLARCRYVTKASFMVGMGLLGLRPDLINDWTKSEIVFEGQVRLDHLKGDEQSYLALTTRGARALAAATGVHVEGRSLQRLKRPNQKLAHDICTGELSLAVMTLAKDGFIDLVGVETDDKKLAFSTVVSEPDAAPERVTLRPDAMVAAKSAYGTMGYLIETDRGTVQLKTMMRRYRAYLAWAKDGGPFRDFSIKALRVLTVASSAARMKALMETALESNHGKPSGFLVFALQDYLTVQNSQWWLGPVAHALGTVPESRIPLLPERESESLSA